MSVVGRIIAGAREWSLGGPIGALLERVIRHLPHWPAREGEPPASDPRRRVAFTIAVIALGAKMAKADGVVTRDEVAAFREVFQIPPGEEEHVRLIFDLARKSTAGFDSYARQVGRLFAQDRGVLEDLLGGLFHIALADGRVCPAEDAYLRQVAHHFGFGPRDYARIRALHLGATADGEDPHAMLGVAPDASAEEIRAAYHRLVRENHPDLLMSQGLPPECVALASARLARINAAHDRLSKGDPERVQARSA
ncbi:MAG: molecular chaperone DjiA [Alphaproteobacteria bacterium]|nr:molecular chaperone DjiA [Alphaproteobacteria bacterium]MBV9860903.1 molecular chaperone DjiA [Alphaproteobacteria bacterium]